MKKFIFLFALISFTAVGQETKNFKIESYELIWQYVYETDLTQEEVLQNLSTKGIWESFEKVGDELIAISSNMDANYKPLGYGEMSVPMYVARMFVNFHSLIEIKDGRYRVTISNIQLVQKYDDPLVKQGQVISLKDFAINKKGEFKRMFLGKASDIYNHTFKTALEIKKEEEEEGDDW